jgi:hypothetical protein
MNHETFASAAILAAAMAAAGAVFGLAYFAALHRTATLLAAGRGWMAPSALTLGRIGAAVVLLALIARLGALALIAAFLGFLAARAIALHVARGPG